jgi:four helix bundle protein
VFQAAHTLAISIYKETRDFPRDEWYGLRAQLRRAAVSTVSNIVEGNARRGTLEYVNFLNIARGSAAEAEYLVLVASELGYLSITVGASLRREYAQLIPQLESLVQKMRRLAEHPTKD